MVMLLRENNPFSREQIKYNTPLSPIRTPITVRPSSRKYAPRLLNIVPIVVCAFDWVPWRTLGSPTFRFWLRCCCNSYANRKSNQSKNFG
ncbi:hypothetical protein A4A49_03015 [Nicotiana attenuata]|uniref:Uncharacterized protein n=1 Tax=Nicotiana attenuata TaxID=49451 RepID=A0A314L0K7_NICAT|nr:hypothetical protein A4A49_03015 [Nicotiana attenuata]